MPLDRYQREINYLRISVIDRCNLRCTYCMPLGDLQFAPADHLLTPDEIQKVVQASVEVGFRKFRLTGGEPLLRRDIVDIVKRVREVPGVDDLAMTTNAILLPKLADSLKEAGLRRVNIHLDTLNPQRLRQIMRRGDLDGIWKGIEAAEKAGLTPIKLNTVVVRGVNDDDVVDLARLTVERDWHVRFIELMPLGGGECAQYSRDKFVSNHEVREKLEREIGALELLPIVNISDESKNMRFPGTPGTVGFISPVSEPFCGTCNRLRLTSDGRFHLCLLQDDELDCRHALREGGGLDEVRAILLRAVGEKPNSHDLLKGLGPELRSMYHLGG